MLQFITNDHAALSHIEQVEKACHAGVQWIQLRMKGAPYTEWLYTASQCQEICNSYGTTLIINDNVTIAREIKANGVHLGKKDMHPLEARRALPEGSIIGGTANTLQEIEQLIEYQVDYIGLGPYRMTTTKSNLAPILGMSQIQGIMEQLKNIPRKIPVIAIGGIELNDIEDLQKSGVQGIAISSAITHAQDMHRTIQQFLERTSYFAKKGEYES